MERRYLVKGFAAAAGAPILLAGLVAIAFSILNSPPDFFAVAWLLYATVSFAGMISIVIVLVFGVPAQWLLGRLGYTSLRAYLATGLLIALIPFTLLAWDYKLGGEYAGGSFGYNFLALLLTSGPLAAAAFWAIARPDCAGTRAASQPGP